MNDLYFPHKPVGRNKAILNIGISVGAFALAGASLLLGPEFTVVNTFVDAAVPIVVGLSTLDNAKDIFNRLKRYDRYVSLFHGNSYLFIDEIAEYMGKKENSVVKDLRRMISDGMFPEAIITEDKSILILNRPTYDKYILEQRRRKMLIEDKVISSDDPLYLPFSSNELSEGNDAVSEARGMVKEVRYANLEIKDEEVTSKINRMESLSNQIIDHVEMHPESLGSVRKYIQYYLPTTVKLLTTYRDYEKLAIPGDNIAKSKMEIKNALDSINVSFEKLFNSLYAGISMDISTEIEVLQTMLQQEGLVENDFTLE